MKNLKVINDYGVAIKVLKLYWFLWLSELLLRMVNGSPLVLAESVLDVHFLQIRVK